MARPYNLRFYGFAFVLFVSMSSLIVLLPPGGVALAGMELSYALVSDSGMLTNQGAAPLARLPKASDIILQIPAQALSWLQIDLPKPGRAMPSAKLRAVLEGLLEDQILRDVHEMHFALPAQAPGGEKTWVAVCDKAWLSSWLQLFENAGRAASRIVPQAEPQAQPTLHIQGTPDSATFISSAADGVLHLPLNQIRLLALDMPEDVTITAEPAVAALAEQHLQGRKVQLLQSAQHMANTLGSNWNLGQFDLSTSGRGRALQKILRALRNFAFGPAWRAARIALALLLLANIIGLNVWAWQERNALKTKRAQLARAVKEMTGADYVSDTPVKQAEMKLTALRQATGALTPQDLEPMLNALAAGMPQQMPDTVLTYDNQELRVQGKPLPPDSLQNLRARASQLGYSVLTTDDVLQIISDPGAGSSAPALAPAPAPAVVAPAAVISALPTAAQGA